MSSDNNITVDFGDAQSITRWLETVSEDVMSGVRHGVAQGTNILRDATLQGVRSANPNFLKSSGKSHYGSTFYTTPLIYGVRTYMIKGAPTGYVSILGTPYSYGGDDGTWRLRFFENGTKPRRHRSGKEVGRIEGLHFFSNAISSSETKAIDCIKTAIEEEIDKLNAL